MRTPIHPGGPSLGSQGRSAAYGHSPAGGDVVGMLDRITDGILVVGADWRCSYLNQPAAEMLGRPREEILGRDIWGVFPDAAGHPFQLAYEQAMRERHPVQFTAYYPPLERWFETRSFPDEDRLVVLFRDITERRVVEEQLREYSDRMSEAERIAGFGVWRWEMATGQVRWSDQLHRIYGVEPGGFEGTVDAFLSYLHPDDRDRVWSSVEHALHSLEPFAFEERIIRANGEERLLDSRGRAIAGSDGQAAALVGVCHDVTDRSAAERALGLSERRVRAIIDHTPSIIAVKDLDGRYTMANAECARIVGCSQGELVGRDCADVFPEISERQRANDRQATADREPVYDEAVLLRDGEPRSYVTVTFALPDQSGQPVETCTIGTDVTERKEHESARRERLDWAQRINSALDEGRMLVYGQPVVDMATNEPEGCELLVRMRSADDPDHLLQPGSFLPAAERFGLIQQIDVWMVSQALGMTSALAPQVNLSAVTLCDAAARRQIVAQLRSVPEGARRLVFEITETAVAEHLEAAIEFAADLTELGCGLALDDFGTGFGSFTYLRKLPLRYLKIDRSFVTGVASSRDDQRVVQSIIGIAEQFGLGTIAEGIEDQATFELLRKLGTHYAQGFYLGRPSPVSAAGEA